MKKSILLYLGVAFAAALIIFALGRPNDSPPNQDGELFTYEREVPFFRGHPSPILEQKYFDIFTEPNGEEYFTTISRERNAIEVQPLNGSEYFTIRPDSFYGPDSIKMSIDLIFCYKIVSWDSIFLIDKAGTKVYMADRNGSISTYWTVTDTICRPPSFTLRGYQFSNLSYTDNALYLSYLPFFYTSEEIFACDAIAKVPLPPGEDSVRIESIFGPYPQVYTNRERSYGAASYLSSFAQISTTPLPTFVISFPKDHNMYRVDEQGSDVPIDAKSDAIEKFRPFKGNPMNNVDNIRYEAEEPRYWKVMHDPYRKLFYRIALHNQPFEGPDGKNRTLHEKPWSIMVFDENFLKLGEQDFKAKEFFPKDVFVAREGLYVSNALVPDKDGQPSFNLSFSLFKVNPPAL